MSVLISKFQVPHHFQFTCDSPGIFDLYFCVHVADLGGGVLGQNYHVCRGTVGKDLVDTLIDPPAGCTPRAPLAPIDPWLGEFGHIHHSPYFSPIVEGTSVNKGYRSEPTFRSEPAGGLFLASDMNGRPTILPKQMALDMAYGNRQQGSWFPL